MRAILLRKKMKTLSKNVGKGIVDVTNRHNCNAGIIKKLFFFYSNENFDQQVVKRVRRKFCYYSDANMTDNCNDEVRDEIIHSARIMKFFTISFVHKTFEIGCYFRVATLYFVKNAAD